MACIKPYYLRHLATADRPDGVEVPCGKCKPCKKRIRSEWALRCKHELENWSASAFVTLTYDEKHLPKNGSLVKKDLQLFFKRLRQFLWKTEKRRIKYYASGEYGDRLHRPHYHIVLFGVSWREKDKIRSEWKNGLVDVRLLTGSRIYYAAKYINKKFSGELAFQTYYEKGLERPFQLVSQGLGLYWAKHNKDRLLKDLAVKVSGGEVIIPRYYRDKLGIDQIALGKKYEDYRVTKLLKHLNKINPTEITKEVLNSVVCLEKAERIQSSKNLDARVRLDSDRF